MNERIKKTVSKTEDMVDSLSLLIGAVVVVVVGIILRSFGGKKIEIDIEKLAKETAERLGDSKILTDKREIQDIADFLKNIPPMSKTERDQKDEETPKLLKQIAEDYKIIAKRIEVEEAIDDLGMFQAPYDDFMRNVGTEIQHLQNWKSEGIQGYDFAARSSLLKFALNMAIVYARVMGHHETIPMMEKYLEAIERIYSS